MTRTSSRQRSRTSMTNYRRRVCSQEYMQATTATEGRDSDKVGNTLTTWRYEEETQSIRSERVYAEGEH
eukprot:438004-Amphidinium_carterae.1